jgi:hypothetical protein
VNELDLECAQRHLRRLVVSYGSQSRAALALAAYYGLTYDLTAGWFHWLRGSHTNAFKSPGVALMLEQMPEDINPFKPQPRVVVQHG